ncbi:TetR/AcrR family transcriptional regulator [Amycolatopsis thailandensis]|uniref:TetR/AcrR family transcriptional regulator n=1 Tax=Amycolatopsis thailandensis TaxID=589330 RepID=UPI00366342CD
MGAGRPREFDVTAVLDAVAGRFRVRGFADTSTEQLCEAAGVRRSSLYNTFTSKNELFVRALERQTSLALEQQAAVLTDERLPGAERLVALFDLVLAEERAAGREGHAAGCMIVASRMAPDLGAREPRVQSLLDRYTDIQLSLVAGAVRAGQLDGTLREDVAPHDAALMVSSAISGLRVLAQSGSGVAELARVAELHLGSLRAAT